MPVNEGFVLINPSFREPIRMHLHCILNDFYSVEFGVVSIINFVCTPQYLQSRYYLLHIHPSGQRPSGCIPKSNKVALVDWRLVRGVWPFITAGAFWGTTELCDRRPSNSNCNLILCNLP